MVYKPTVIIFMALILFFLIHLLIVKLNYAQEDSKWPKIKETSLYKGLYSPTDKVAVLTVDNFNENVYGSTSAWLVQFYNSWCGHCIKFSPTWKALAADIYNWRDVITIGALDCANDLNTEHCRAFEIMGYPTIRFFKPKSVNTTIGEDFLRSGHNVTVIRRDIVSLLESTALESPPEHWPHLKPIKEEDIDSLARDSTKSEFLLAVEDESSFLGRELIIDLNSIAWLTVRRILRADFRASPIAAGILAVKKDRSTRVVSPAENSKDSRAKAIQNIRAALAEYSIPDVLANNVANKDRHIRVKQGEKQQKQVNTLYRVDIETALQISLSREVPLKQSISGASFKALVAYLQVLRKYFPFDAEDALFVPNLVTELNRLGSINGGEFKSLLMKHGDKFYRKNMAWTGCVGSSDVFRGYPCGLWMLFHTLTVHEYNKRPAGTEVLSVMTEYVRNFFGCQECAEHFLEMSRTIPGNVTTVESSVLWLWRAHNNVNRRLARDDSEDPAFPKVQFPLKVMCSQCHRDNNTWDESQVLAYLVNMYTNVHPRAVDASLTEGQPPSYLKPEKSDQTEHNGWNFSLTDVNACIALYVLSACLLTVYTVRLFIKRHPRRHHKYDFSFKA